MPSMNRFSQQVSMKMTGMIWTALIMTGQRLKKLLNSERKLRKLFLKLLI